MGSGAGLRVAADGGSGGNTPGTESLPASAGGGLLGRGSTLVRGAGPGGDKLSGVGGLARGSGRSHRLQ
jgi:hypothetical protein